MTGGNVVNQVLSQYNGLGQLTAEYQSHSGAVNVNTTPAVLYAYAEMAGGANNSRLVSMTYPSGYVLDYNYGAGLDSSISRLSSLSDSGGVLESYKYLGLGTVVERDHPQNNVNLTYISQNGQTGDAGDPYTGLDRFGRVVEQNWYDVTTATSTDDFQYGYDRDGNVLSRTNVLDSIFSEGYTYDNLNQLTGFTRGSHTQTWTPDALGNFTQVVTDGATQTRTANQQNEITSISGSGVVTYDANGNTTADGSGNTFVYDAWNRLVAVKNNGTTVASYGYNGLGERITETHGATTTDLYYSSAWQVLEERIGGTAQARNVWSPVYVNALVLRDQSSQQNGVLDQRLYVQEDANWNVTALVDVSGNVQERDLTDPYGAVMVLTASWGTRGGSAYGWLYLFQGGRYDAATGQYHFGYRDWSVALERFDEPDPLGLLPDNNDYRGEGDNPTDRVDPNGLEWLAPWDRRAHWDGGNALFQSVVIGAAIRAAPVVGPPAHAVRQFGGWTAAGWVEGNALGAWHPPYSSDRGDQAARTLGHGLALVQGGAEVGGGSAAVGDGGTITVGTGGVGGVVGVPVAAVGVAVVVHGSAVAVHSGALIGCDIAVMMSSGNPPGGTTPAPGGAPGRSLDDILNDDALFNRWLNRGHPTNQPLSPTDATKVWNKLKGLGKTPRLDAGHPGTQWTMPHINVDGVHIPVDPGFVPPP